MSLLTASDLSRYFGADEIFSGINLAIAAGARIALVGANGAGKTSLINLLAGIDLPSGGTVKTARKLKIAHLPQRPELAGDHSLWQEQLRAFADLRALERQLARFERELADAAGGESVLEEYGRLQSEFERRGGYRYETRIKMTLSGLGFAPAEYALPLPQLSGGQKTRALLSRMLLEAAGLLILDEPTNHLDIHAVEWLEKALAAYPGAVLAVSHDRYFIDNFASTIWELEHGRLRVYRGNYRAYATQRKLARETLRQAYAGQRRFVEKEREFIRRHMGSRGTAQAKGRLKKLETMKKRGRLLEGAPRQRKKMSLEMAAHQRSGDKVITTRALTIGYDPAAPLLHLPDLLVLRGETVAILGANGVGKSTLLKTLAGALPPLAGDLRRGAKVKIGFFAQAHENLCADNSLLDEIFSVKPMPLSQARNWLGRFLFSGEDVFRRVASLSGGERGRLALAKLALQGANLLLLDEPTNHLDIDSQEVLQEVLQGYGGTILLVSHDRYLIDALATQIWELAAGALTVTAGGYQHYLRERNRRLQAQADAPAETAPRPGAAKKAGLNRYQAARRTVELEERIDILEAKLRSITDALHEASLAGDAPRVRDLGSDYSAIETELESALTEWESLTE